MLSRLFGNRQAPERAVPTYRLPDGIRVYAIGDVHGRDDLLAALHEKISSDVAARPVERAVLVHLGDYVDRGPRVRETIARLLDGPPEGVDEAHALLGNHEETLLQFLEDPAAVYGNWAAYGGLATLMSYGVGRPGPAVDEKALWALRDEFAQKLSPAHLDFLRSLPRWKQVGDFYFVHAGVRPGVSLGEQTDYDLVWIRDAFLQSRKDFGARVVHGHSIAFDPEVHPNRIAVDTGAYATGRLTAAVIEGSEVNFLATA